MAKLKTKAPLSYYGSDAGVARELGAMFDGCNHVTILMCGGMSIVQYLKAKAIVANDLNDLAINFYKVASDSEINFLLFDRCKRTLSHPAELKETRELLSSDAPIVERAWAYWAQCWLTHKGKGGTPNSTRKPSVRRKYSGGTNATRIQSAANDLKAWAEHFKRCEFECRDFRGVLHDCKDVAKNGIYCDPCWLGPGDQYIHTMSWGDHIDLYNGLCRFDKALVVVRYGDHPDIRRLYRASRWNIIEASSRTQANKNVSEIWITNRK